MSESNDNGYKYLRAVGNHWRKGSFLGGGGRQSTDVAFALLNQLSRFRFLVLTKFLFLAWLIVINVTGSREVDRG